MVVYTLEKKMLGIFLESITKSYELIAPVKRDLVRFERIEDVSEIYLEKNSYFPLKEFFFRKQETILVYDGRKLASPKIESPERIFFGIRKCDLNAIHHQDKVFIEDANDPFYISARKNSYLIGYHCNSAPSEYCFCGTLELIDFFDLMIYDKQDYYLAEVGSEKGRFIVDKFNEFFSPANRNITQEERKIKNSDRLKNPDISGLYDNPDWNKGVSICLSCSACTSLCPTCYCFDFHDEISTKSPEKSVRKRDWSSCQLPEFTRVAGNHTFRQEREERFKHRIYHQLDYFKQKYGINLCVGCGRCIEGCPTRIDFVDIINGMKQNPIN